MIGEELTQASTLALEEEVESDESNLKGCWGILKSLNPSFPDVYLKNTETTFGRYQNTNINYHDKNISGLHCKIIRDGGTESDGTVIAFVHDTSTNGTFLDGVKIGKGEKRLLIANAELSLTPKKPDRIAYLFQLPEKEDDQDGPQKVYLFGEQLGAGNFATVKLAVERKTGSKFAVKIIDKKKYFMNASTRKDSLMDEVNILRDLHHPNIIHIHEVYDTEKTLYLVLELVECGELLNDIISSDVYSEEKAKNLFKQIVEGVLYLHRKGIAHRDLKPENILLKHRNFDQPDSIKLSDFGLSRTISEGSFMKTMCGTPQYLAPEILTNSSNGVGGYGLEVDCWSMGAILYIMLCGYPPFDDNKDISIFEQIRKALFDFPDEEWKSVSDEAKDLIKRLLCVEPQKRYTCEQILDHPWYNKVIIINIILIKITIFNKFILF
ncbi:hypothetical protein DICPUDRAFT_29047 [Dictyostelium purpureum]|uniref:non-specific serine/threonine protein kinase n=1 Tax=Dictyostelium purpureum TaxID=5786 RepID=F0ZCY1_DICPU|nr:uncharacterized protein DICPUDRAFT_29047 [Dictyostelium purpureum]EGC38218.1 hypothetical protein DICPUDRAFT_29047 [Dictyostelium purpureum]|eukprot:XP_003285256.1 hypothetical protein DICPUDRAFT_29047 [Dictyostelium purpureum]